MRLSDLYEAEKAGTFVGVRLTSESIQRLVGWMDQNLIKNPTPADAIHCTLILKKDQKFPHDPIRYDPPIPIDPKSYKIDLFGEDKNVMVLKFESEFLLARHNQLKEKHGIVWDFGDFVPYITLTYEVQEIQSELEPPDFAIELEREYVEEFGWSSDETS